MAKRTKAEIAEAELTADELLFKLLANKVGSVDPSKVISYDKNTNTLKIGGEKLKPNELTNLKNEVAILKNSRLWLGFTNNLKHEAHMRMFELAKTDSDLFWGKCILHAVGVLEHIVSIIENAQLSTPSPISRKQASVL